MSDYISWHRNGGATIIGTESHVSHDSYCDQKAKIFDSIVHNSTIIGESRLDHSQITRATIDHVIAEKSFIADASVSNSYLHDTVVASLKGQTPLVRGVVLRGVVVEGNAVLQGPWRLEGAARIPTGTWTRPPRFIEIRGENLFVGVTESTDGYALIACRRKPIKQWFRAGPRLGRILGWSTGEVKQVRLFFEMLLDCPMEA